MNYHAELVVYGTQLCPDTVAAQAQLAERGIAHKYIEITDSIAALKEFLRLRDTHPAFADAKAQGYAGVPAFMLGSQVTLDLDEALIILSAKS